MAELVLSALLPVVFEKLTSILENKITRSKGIHSELKKWERKLFLIRALLSDASQKEIKDEAVKQWLNGLQHLVYDIDDILDALATDAMYREFVNESQPITNKVRKFIPSCCTSFSLSTRVGSKLDNISTRLQELMDEKDKLGLSVKNEGSKDKNRSYQTSLECGRGIVGREGDKKELVQKLLSDESCNENFGIVPIVGMGGIGKTTLARALYNDQLVKDHFELKAWVCVSDDFDSFKISKVIYQEVGGEQKDLVDLNRLQVALRDQLMGKRFLLVLDDVWSDKWEDWKTLEGPFFAGASGSKIIITTRKKELLRKLLNHDHPYILEKLSPDDAVSLFAQNALGENNFDLFPELRQHGEGIVQKCDGLPLALEALGRLLRNRTDEEEWKRLLANEIWMLEDDGGILPALRLSYHDLSACLKQLFAYCCLIPKDYVFEKKELILWWMAEGFLHDSATNKTMECLGEEYFQELLSRSFFQHVPDEESLFVMHDLMNDLATFVAGEFFSRLDLDVKKDLRKTDFEKFRHMSFVCEEYMTYNKFKAFERANRLRTFLAMPNAVRINRWQRCYLSSKILVDILPQLPLLRVLSLSRLDIDEVPDCVGNMKHLRYLNLSRTRITHLPESVCNLNNLQTLIVSGCGRLTKLPDDFLKLKNLRHFDIRDTLLWNKMPLEISDMKSLQTLSNKVVIENDDFFISGLRNSKYLQAEIYIDELQKVQSAKAIQEVNLSQKRVSKLHIGWSIVFNDSRNEKLEMEVLDALKPHSDNLKDLAIVSYGGKLFPNWIGDPSFLRLTSVCIRSCGNCMFLPPLGELPSLRELVIQELNKVKVVGSEFLGTGIAFPKLESLRITNMLGWEVWSTKSGVVGAVMFPCLQVLYIEKCPNLAKISLEALPSLRELEISYCGNGLLTSLIHVTSAVTKLSISHITGLSDEVWRGVMDYLGAVEEVRINDCNEIRYLWESEAEASKVLVNLMKLHVEFCSKLVSLREKEEDGCILLTSLRMLYLWNCENLERCNLPNSIEELSIYGCPLIASVSFPTGEGHKLKSLTVNRCEQLLEKEVLLNTSMPGMLEVVHITRWKNLKSINELTCFIHIKELIIIQCECIESMVELTCFIHLTELRIEGCSNIESFPAADLPKLTSLKRLTIKDCKSMDVDSFEVWPPNLAYLEIGCLKKPISKWGPQNFPPSLVDLELYGPSADEDDVTGGSQLSHMLPSALTTLYLWRFEQLESVSKGLQHLTSLQHLAIGGSPKMKDLPEMLLPSLSSLGIIECPDELKEKTSIRGSYWPLISYIPHVYIRQHSEDSDADSFRDSSSDESSDNDLPKSEISHRLDQLSLNYQHALQEGFSSDEGESTRPQGCLSFEYMEHNQPWGREPLTDKILDLARCFPELKSIKSCDLLPSSWLSVAWHITYPDGWVIRRSEAVWWLRPSGHRSRPDVSPPDTYANMSPQYHSIGYANGVILKGCCFFLLEIMYPKGTQCLLGYTLPLYFSIMSESSVSADPGDSSPRDDHSVKFDIHLRISKTSQVDVRALVEDFGIPEDLNPRPPLRGLTMDLLPEDAIGLYVIRYFKVHISQLVPLGMHRVTLFEVYSRSLHISPTTSLFRVFYKLSKQGSWFSFEKRAERNRKVCFGEFPSCLKGWKQEFFLIDRRAILFAMPWRHHDSDVSDPFPKQSVTMSDYLKKPSVCKVANVVRGDKYPEGHAREMHITQPLASNAEVPKNGEELKKVEVADDRVLLAKEEKKEQAIRTGPKKPSGTTRGSKPQWYVICV
ncbi:NB-ARC domains-containing protein [Artemisia annua]|uniref:NB-ARC domains-containing protein n=1 Tax=Artemisia annua TaxID=35608 RepID=A0A2U1M7J6_ARTAN|nr:NB-ARC domains-containing protein [Artemisia annua]